MMKHKTKRKKIETKKPLPKEQKDELICPYSHQIFLEPVTLMPCGHSAEKEQVELAKKVAQNQPINCPCCRTVVTDYAPNHALRNTIDQLLTVFTIEPGDRYELLSPPTVTANHHVIAQIPSSATQHLMLQNASAMNLGQRQVKLPSAIVLVSPYFLPALYHAGENSPIKVSIIGRGHDSFWSTWNPFPSTIGIDSFRYHPDEDVSEAGISHYEICSFVMRNITDPQMRYARQSNIILLFPDQEFPLVRMVERIQAESPRIFYIRYQRSGVTFIPELTKEEVPELPPTMQINATDVNLIQEIGKQLMQQSTEELIAWANELRDVNSALNQEGRLCGSLRSAPTRERSPSPSCSLM